LINCLSGENCQFYCLGKYTHVINRVIFQSFNELDVHLRLHFTFQTYRTEIIQLNPHIQCIQHPVLLWHLFNYIVGNQLQIFHRMVHLTPMGAILPPF